MNFLNPEWFYALVVIPFIIIAAVVMLMNRSQIWRRLTAQRHENSLVKQHRRIMHWISFSVSILGITMLVTAMARPYHGETAKRSKVETRNVLIAVDTSLSMLCDDVQPTRLDRAISISNNIVDALPNEHIALMAFAGTPNIISPFTVNGAQLKTNISALTPLSTSRRGSDLPAAIDAGIEIIKTTGQYANAMIILTDGAETSKDLDRAIDKAKKYDIQVFCIGIGTKAGGTITVNNFKHRDRSGRVVTTKLEDYALRQLASGTSGFYTTHNNNPAHIIQEAIEKMNTYEKEGRIRQIPNETYQWFVGAGVLLLLIGAMLRAHWRFSGSVKPNIANTPAASLIALSTFLILSASQTTKADNWFSSTSDELFEKPAIKKNAYQALSEGEYKDAIKYFEQALDQSDGDEHAELSLALGQAHYRLKNYTGAASAYSKALLSSDKDVQSQSQYNLANAIYKSQMKDIKIPKEMSLDDYFDNALTGQNGVTRISKGEMIKMKQSLADAQEHFSDVSKADNPMEQAGENLALTEKTIDAIDKALNKKDPKPPTNPGSQNDDNNPEDKSDNSGDKKDPEQTDKPNDKGNPKPDDGGEPKDEDPNGKPDQPQPPKDPKDDSKKNPDKGDKPDGKKNDKDNPEQSDKDPEKKDNNTDTKPKESTGNPLDFLEQHSDLQIKPTKRRSFREIHPEIDW